MNIIGTDIIDRKQDVFWEPFHRLDDFTPRRVLVVSTPFDARSKEEEQLLGILKSGCRLLDDQYNIIQLKENEQVAWHKIKGIVQPKVVLLFSILPSNLGVNAMLLLNNINNFENSFWVPSVSLTQLMQDVNTKGTLWNHALKPLFVDKVHGDVLVNR